jgi:primosomal protein N' (replication factor Y)
MITPPESNSWSIAVDAPLWQPLTYRIPDGLEVRSGQRVHVPLGRRNSTGVLLEPVLLDEDRPLKEIQSLYDDDVVLSEKFISWLKWLSRYYVYPLGQVFGMVYPPLKKSGRGSKKKSVVEIAQGLPATAPPELTDEQAAAVSGISASPGFNVHLLWGVTGSGKTEVYLRLIAERIKANQTTLFLVPEISLTPQMIQRFTNRFGNEVAVLHSQLTEREKTDQWWHVVAGRKKVLIGARSALFCPVPNLGLIVIDEEHETSFKQEDHLRYHARDAGIMLAKTFNIPIVLGSATPSIETFKKVQDGQYKVHQLTRRVAERPMPDIRVIDMRAHKEERKLQLPHWLSEPLFEALQATLARGKQAALFLNRRGIAPTLLCQHCGHTWSCPNCAIQLTVHGRGHMLCHYCGYHENRPEYCIKCNEPEPKNMGAGTEQIEEDIRKLFPTARVGRADRDEIRTREDLEQLISDVEHRRLDFLIGTQMIAKGLDFPGLELVGVVLADVGFSVPDFRAAERAFQLLTQVSGRSGRHVTGDERGAVIIQTYNPSHPAIHFTQQHDYVGFVRQELTARAELHYPPYARFASVRFSSTDKDKAKATANSFRIWLQQLLHQRPQLGPITVLGPTEAPLSKLKGQYRYILLCKCQDPIKLSQALATVVNSRSRDVRNVRIAVDIDPYHLM